MRKLLIVSIAAAFLTLPQIASAQSPPPTQKQQSLQSQMKSNLEQAGFSLIEPRHRLSDLCGEPSRGAFFRLLT